jgi:hypothetical protein
MIDVTGPKVAIPAILFAVLSPGLLLQLPEKGLKLATGETSRNSVLFHALVFFIVFTLISKVLGIVLKPADALVPTLLFILLSPGLLLQIPGKGGLGLLSGQTSTTSVLVHTVVFAVLFALLRKYFPQVY